MRLLTTLALSIIATTAFAEAPLALPDPTCAGYPTIQDAAVHVLDAAMAESTTNEYAGVLYVKDGLYCYTAPVSNGRVSEFKIKVRLPSGTKLAALFHTHPGKHDSDMFSPEDLDVAKQMRVVSFIGVVRDHSIRSYDPQSDMTKTEMHPMRTVSLVTQNIP